MSGDLTRAVNSILNQAGITPDQNVVIGVSGGPDSLALLHVMGNYMHAACLWVAHLNHGLRLEAEEEAAFVSQVAAVGGLPFRSKKVDVARLSRNQGWSIEEAGRNARYQFLGDVAKDIQTNVVIVAHNADDQAETVLHHLLRGSGLRGIQGMRPESSLPGKVGIKLLRPLLTTSRAEVEAYCREHELQPMLDSTNRDPAYLRNRLRHELLPILADFNPQIKEHLRQLADIVAADEAYVDEQSGLAWQLVLRDRDVGWLRLDLGQWRSLPLSLRRRILRRAMAELRPSVTDIPYRTIDLAHHVGMDKETGAEATLPGGIKLRLDYEHLLIATDLEQIPVSQPQLPRGKPQTLLIPGSVTLDGDWLLTAAESDINPAAVRENPDPWLAYLDIGQEAALQVRPRIPGEHIQSLGMGGRSASVQDVMVNRKVPAGLRDCWPIVATDDHPLWLVGLHIDERAKVTEHTWRIIKLSCYQVGDLKTGFE